MLKKKRKFELKKRSKSEVTNQLHATDIEMVPIDNLIPLSNELNAKNASSFKNAIPKLAALLTMHGIRTPLTVWRKTKTIYKGNLTWHAAKAAGFTEVPVSYQDFVSNAAALAYAISDNVSGRYTEYDDAILSTLMKSKDFSAINASLAHEATGLSRKQLDRLGVINDVITPDINLTHNEDEERPVGYITLKFKTKREYMAAREQLGLSSEANSISFNKAVKLLTGVKSNVKKFNKKV